MCFWILASLAQAKHLAVLHQDPSRLAVTVRAPRFAMDALVLHAPVEGSEGAELWWGESFTVAKLLPAPTSLLCLVDANARVGSLISEAIGDDHHEEETVNGALFHAWLLRLRICAFSTFRCKGHGGTWRSSAGHLRRIDYVCGSQHLLAVEFDVVVVAREFDVATVRDDHFPVILELVWRATACWTAPSWAIATMHRQSVPEWVAAENFKRALQLAPVCPSSLPVDEHHAAVATMFKEEGARCFPIPPKRIRAE